VPGSSTGSVGTSPDRLESHDSDAGLEEPANGTDVVEGTRERFPGARLENPDFTHLADYRTAGTFGAPRR